MNTITRILATTLIAAAAGLASTAHAEEVQSRSVYYGDLNLSSAAGVQTLYVRIRSAARAVCPGSNTADIKSKTVRNECIAKAIDEAVQEVNQPALAALHGVKPLQTASR